MFQKLYIKIQNLREDDKIYEEIRFLKCVAYFSVVSAFACLTSYLQGFFGAAYFPFVKGRCHYQRSMPSLVTKCLACRCNDELWIES